MEELRADLGKPDGEEGRNMPESIRRLWPEQTIGCGGCRFRDQDIDTYPCAACHTRT